MNSYDYSKVSKKFSSLNINVTREEDDYTDYNAFSLYDDFVKGDWSKKSNWRTVNLIL